VVLFARPLSAQPLGNQAELRSRNVCPDRDGLSSVSLVSGDTAARARGLSR